MFKRGQIETIVKLSYCFIVFLAAMFFGSKSVFAATDHLLINEIYPNPVAMLPGEVDDIKYHEWIELYNPTSEDIDLTKYILEDEKGHSFSSLIGLTIKAGDYLFATDENILNNTGDSVFLKNTDFPDNNIDQVIYGDTKNNPNNAPLPKIGESITRILNAEDTGNNSVDFVIAVPTPGVAYEKVINIVDQVKEKESTIEDARNLENDEDVVVAGTVITLPGVLSSQYFYIQDETGGIQVYCHSKTFPTLVLGDVVSVAGELSQTNNERRVKISSADNIVILNHTDPIVPKEIAVSNIGEKNEGTYVKTAGIVTETSGDTFYISDGNSEIKVVINKTTGIDKPKMKKGDQVEVTGIVSQYKDEYRILPIDQDDVKIVASEYQLPRAGSGELIYIIIGLFLTVLWNIFLKAKRKLSKLLAI